MKKSILILAICILTGNFASAKVYTITNSGSAFVPDEIIISPEDTVVFSLASIHNAIEVSEATWIANGNTSNGGFTVPFGGGAVTNLGAGTHYYVCELHASMGMKGKIEVSVSTGTEEENAYSGFTVFPNPFENRLQINYNVSDVKGDYVKIINIIGETVYSSSNEQKPGFNTIQVDLGFLPGGIYFVLYNQRDKKSIKRIIKQ